MPSVEELLGRGLSGWDVLLAIGALVAGWLGGRLARRGAGAVLSRTPNIGPSARAAASRIAQYSVTILGCGVALVFLGADVQPLVAISLIVAVILTLMLRGVSDNFAAGVLIQLRQPFELGHSIEVSGAGGTIAGKVLALNARAVVLETADSRTVRVPNAMFLQNPVFNDSELPTRRGVVEVHLQRDASIAAREVELLLSAAVERVDGVVLERQPEVFLKTVSAEQMVVDIHFWSFSGKSARVTSNVIHALSEQLEQDVRFTATSAGLVSKQ